MEVLSCIHINSFKAPRVNTMNIRSNFIAIQYLRASSKFFGKFFRDDNEIFFTDFWDFNRKGKFIVLDSVLFISRNQLSGRFNFSRNNSLNEVYKSHSMAFILIIEVESIIIIFDFKNLFLNIMLENNLL